VFVDGLSDDDLTSGLKEVERKGLRRRMGIREEKRDLVQSQNKLQELSCCP
jgi:hypothetical protein